MWKSFLRVRHEYQTVFPQRLYIKNNQMFFISCWYILGQHHRIVAWVAKCKSLPQHWHVSSKGNMNIPSTNSRKHTCFLFFNKYFVFLNIYSSFSPFPIISRKIRNPSKPYSAVWESISGGKKQKGNQKQYSSEQTGGSTVGQFHYFTLFFRFCFNIEHIRHALTTSTSTPPVVSVVHEITRCSARIQRRLDPRRFF